MIGHNVKAFSEHTYYTNKQSKQVSSLRKWSKEIISNYYFKLEAITAHW